MDAILDRVKLLTDHELRENLKKYGVNLGPVTLTTRKIFQKKLGKIIFSEEYPEQTDSSETQVNTVTKDIPTAKNEPAITPMSTDSHTISASGNVSSMFYAVCLPPTEEMYEGELVFVDKMTALNLMKKYKDSRFKAFKNRKDADDFTKPVEVKVKPPADNEVTSSETGIEKNAMGVAVEKSAFKGPKTSELVTLRRIIERGDLDMFAATVWDNPRYLISSADTPVILHEGLRYNALHVAAISNKPAICKVILNTVSNSEFTQKLYCFSQESAETKQRRIDFVFDLYLNMPDKGNGESPLHFASKFGFPDVVRVLLEYPRVDRNMLNKYEETPLKVSCSRTKTSSPELKARIEELLQGLCYVPLLRSEDNTTAALVGQPWSPDNIVEPHELQMRNPTDPQLAIRAYAGPMSPSKAQLFHRQWTTPPSPSSNRIAPQSNVRREDGDKGFERIGRQLAQDMHVPWCEYWEFLDSFVDFSMEKGISVLENYLLKQQASSVYRQWVTTHSFQINNVNLDSSVVSEYSGLNSFTDNNSIVSVDSEASPFRNDLFRHNKIDRSIIKDFNNSDNEISEVFAQEKPERTSDSSAMSETYRNDRMDCDADLGNECENMKKDVKSRFVLQPARLRCGIDAPDSCSFKTQSLIFNSGDTELLNSMDNSEKQSSSRDTTILNGQNAQLSFASSDTATTRFESQRNNLTDEIKLATPSPEPCDYDFKYSGENQTVQNILPNIQDVMENQSTVDNPGTPPWRDGRIESGDSEDAEHETSLKDLDNSVHTPKKEGIENLDESVLKGFQKLQLGSSDEDSFQSAHSDVFSTPNNPKNLDMSFNSQLTNLCDDLKQKLIFTPHNRLSRTVSVVSSLSENQEAIILKTKYSNFNCEMLNILSNFKPTSDNPVPVLLVVKTSESHKMETSKCDIVMDCVIFELNFNNDCLQISQVCINLVIAVPTSEQKNKLLSSNGSMIFSLCLCKDSNPNCVELSVPALLCKIEPKDSFYILGQRASKLDQDVFRALVSDDKEMSCFPLTEKWLKNITSLQAENQQCWPSPSRIRRESRLSGEFPMMSPLVAGCQLASPSTHRYASPFRGQRTSLSPSVFQFTPRTSRLTSSPKAPKFNLEKHLEEVALDELESS